MKQAKYIVDRQWLEKQLDNPQVVIVDCRFQLADPDWGVRAYQQNHLPGAYYLDLNRDLSAAVGEHGGRHPLPDSDRLAEKLARMGIVSNETLVVAYDDARFAFAARFWWLLRYLGHERVALLDGGWQGWVADNYPVSSAVPIEKPGRFLPQPHLDWLADIAAVRAVREGTVLIDSRDRDRYFGLREPIDPIAGSIPGAVNSPWKQVSQESGYLQSLAVQQALWSNMQSAKDIIVYCGSGVTACVNLFSLTQAGYTEAKLYPGGWSDWCSYL